MDTQTTPAQSQADGTPNDAPLTKDVIYNQDGTPAYAFDTNDEMHQVEGTADEVNQAQPDPKGDEQTAEASPSEPAEGDQSDLGDETDEDLKERLSKAELEAVRRRTLAPPPTVISPRDAKPSEVEFEMELGDIPDFDSEYDDLKVADEKRREWIADRARAAGEAHAKKLHDAHQEAQAKQHKELQVKAWQQQQQQKQNAVIGEAFRRSGLEQAEFRQRIEDVARNTVPVGYQGQEQALPNNFAAEMMDMNVQSRMEAGVPVDGYDTSVEFTTELVSDPAMAKRVTETFMPRSKEAAPATLTLLNTIVTSPRGVETLKAATGSEEGRKMVADLIATAPARLAHDRMIFDHWVGHVQSKLSGLEADTPAEEKKSATDGYRPPPANTTHRGRTASPKNDPPEFATREWEKEQDAAIDKFYEQNGRLPRPGELRF